MLYRRKIILALIQTFDGSLVKTDFQKLLFLITRLQKSPSFDFVPYKFGCFSFQSYSDLSILKNQNLVKEIKGEFKGKWIKSDSINYFEMLKENDRTIFLEIKRLYGKFSSNELIKYTYEKYPYYAINSTIADEILDSKTFDIVKEHKPNSNELALFTIGYQGLSLESYLNKLIKYDIKVLCDVRNNPFSMKYCFSKKPLYNACESLSIKYLHFPELGIKAELRKNLDNVSDYQRLFETYSNSLVNKEEDIQKIINLLKKYKRIALTCFESDYCQCHRNTLATYILGMSKSGLNPRHI